MASLGKLLALFLSLLTFVYTFYVVGNFMLFLSRPRRLPQMYVWAFNLLSNQARLETAYGPMVMNSLYLIGFMLQHSCMKSDIVSSVLRRFGLATLERTIYNLTSSLCLHYLLKHWLPAQSIVLWKVDVESSAVLWWTFVLMHVFAWTVIYGGSIIMDLPEILGIKQTYYNLKHYSSPLNYKSTELRQLYTHMRHPSFVGLTLVLWVTNLMTVDRLLLAVWLTAYMYFAWSTDPSDLRYQRRQLERKTHELQAQH